MQLEVHECYNKLILMFLCFEPIAEHELSYKAEAQTRPISQLTNRNFEERYECKDIPAKQVRCPILASVLPFLYSPRYLRPPLDV